MNWEISDIRLGTNNYTTSPLTVKNIRELTAEEKEKLSNSQYKENSYWIEFQENITHNGNIVDNKLRVLRNTYQNGTIFNQGTNTFYYFVNHLNKQVEIPFRRFYNDRGKDGNRRSFFLVSDNGLKDGKDDSNRIKEIDKIIAVEKQKWDKLGYTEKSDLVSDNKKWVDAEVHKSYKDAFANTDLVNSPEKVKEWQEAEKQTNLTAQGASGAYQNGWLPNEIKDQLGSTDGQHYSYNVLNLDKNKVKTAEQEMNEKLKQVDNSTSNNRGDVINGLEELKDKWTSNEQKAVLNANEQKLQGAIDKLKQDQVKENKDNAIQNIKEQWNINATGDKINNQTLEGLLGKDWEKEISKLNNKEEIEKKEQELRDKINQDKKEEQQQGTQLQQSQAIQAIEEYWKNNQDKEGKINGQTVAEALGSNWKEEIGKLDNQKTIAEKEKELQQKIDDAKKTEGQGQVENERNNAINANPNTNQKWEPTLTEEEKAVIKDPSLNSKEAVKEAGVLLAYLREVRNDKENGGPGQLNDWNTKQKVDDAIKKYQEKYFANVKPYHSAEEGSDKGKAWKANNDNLNDVAKNIYDCYYSLICNVKEHQNYQKLKEKSEQLEKQIEDLRAENDGLWRELTAAQEMKTRQVQMSLPLKGGNK